MSIIKSLLIGIVVVGVSIGAVGSIGLILFHFPKIVPVLFGIGFCIVIGELIRKG